MRILSPILFLVIALGGCGREPVPEPAPSAPALVACPVEGTLFPAGHGVAAEARGCSAELCSPGCAYRWRLEPELYRTREPR